MSNIYLFLSQVNPNQLNSNIEKVKTILEVSFKKWGISIYCGPIFLFFLVLLIIFIFFKYWSKTNKIFRRFEVVEADLKIANVGNIKIKPTNETKHIAYQAWVEIMTRKVGLKYNEHYDVLVEVYNSWYSLFGILRDLTKTIPAQRLNKCPDTKTLLDIMIRVLNDGLRPHLTQWQAAFRHWYKNAIESSENKDISPQEIQKKYPNYNELVQDLKKVNNEFLEYAEWLKRIVDAK